MIRRRPRRRRTTPQLRTPRPLVFSKAARTPRLSTSPQALQPKRAKALRQERAKAKSRTKAKSRMFARPAEWGSWIGSVRLAASACAKIAPSSISAVRSRLQSRSPRAPLGLPRRLRLPRGRRAGRFAIHRGTVLDTLCSDGGRRGRCQNTAALLRDGHFPPIGSAASAEMTTRTAEVGIVHCLIAQFAITASALSARLATTARGGGTLRRGPGNGARRA